MKKYSSEEKREYFKEQMEKLKEGIEDKIQEFILNSDDLKKFISLRRKHFYNYSLNNTLLIYRQCPTASYVTGFNKWKELGYRVKKGAKSLSILIPMIRKIEDKESGKLELKIYGFKKGNVFDISQVEATEKAVELPSIDVSVKGTEKTQHTPKRILEATRKFIEQHCKVVESMNLGQSLGMTNGREIYVKPSKNKIDMASILIHEFSHYHNHYKENRKELTKNLKESEAELTTLIFGSYFNLDIEGAYRYLSMYKKDRDIFKCFETAYRTFEYILDGDGQNKGLELILGGEGSE